MRGREDEEWKEHVVARARELKSEGKYTMDEIREIVASEFGDKVPSATTLSAWIRKGYPVRRIISLHKGSWDFVTTTAESTRKSPSAIIENAIDAMRARMPDVSTAKHPETARVYQAITKDIEADYGEWKRRVREVNPRLSDLDADKILMDLMKAGVFYRGRRGGWILASHKRTAMSLLDAL